MNVRTLSALGTALLLVAGIPQARAQEDSAGPGLEGQIELPLDVLRDKIMGGWAAQTIGVTFGGPTEFRYNGTTIADYEPIPWYDGYMKWYYDNAPGLYDDIYMDLTFVDVLEKVGLDAPATAFAQAFAGADYQLWHANQQARYNIQNGLEPPASGHWHNNPEADDIDFQIEADFAGLMSPGMPSAAAQIADRVGHIMNSGDGYYGGLYVATMYALAFVSDDVEDVVRNALAAIPEESTFHQTISDVIRFHEMYPDDWRRTWFEIHRKWSNDIGCPAGVFDAFNIDAKMNAAWVVLGLLYGDGDFTKTYEIAARAGDDSDCNPASAGGILATIKGYSGIPDYWKQGLAEVEPIDFKYTEISLLDAYELTLKHALQMIERNGGRVEGDRVWIPLQSVPTAPLEQNFAGHHPVREIVLNRDLLDEISFDFDGIGFTIHGYASSRDEQKDDIQAEVYVDGNLVESPVLPTNEQSRRFIPFYRYNLPRGEHTVQIRLIDRPPATRVRLDRVIVYDSEPGAHAHP
ncbi:MAG TPA: ADP-ribosylglycohydrolase family protein [Rhodothermales bacterium]